MALPKPRTGDLVHYICTQTKEHCPAIVLVDSTEKRGHLRLAVIPSHPWNYVRTLDGDGALCTVSIAPSVPYARKGLNELGTWHWPEDRPLPVVPAAPEEE